MDRRFGLVAVWALFAAAAVGVGFGAAGLVGDPFTDGVSPVPVEAARGADPPTSPAPDPSTGTPSPNSPSATPPSTAESRRQWTTRAGIVTATCRGSAMQLGGSPYPGWEMELDDDPDDSGRVRFEQPADDDGRVDVRVECRDGRPTFEVDDDAAEDGGND